MPSSQLQTTHRRYHLLLACDGHSQNAAKWPYSVSAGLTPCQVHMPGPCCSLPLHLPSQDLGSLLGVWVQQNCLCQPMEPVSLAHAAVVLARGSSLLVSYRDRSWAGKQLCKAALATLQDEGLPSHTSCTTWSFGVSSPSKGESQGN